MSSFRGNTSWLALFGAGFFWAWLDCLVAQRTLFEPFGSMALLDTAYLLTYAASALPAVIALSLPLLVDRATSFPAVGPGAGLVGAIGCAVIVAGGLAGSPALLMAGIVLSGLSLGALLMLWGRVCVAQGSTHALVHITGAYAVSLFVDLMVMFFQPIPAAVFLALCPLISGALYWVLVKHTEDGRELALGSARTFGELGDDVSPDDTVRFEPQLVAIVLAFYCVLGFANFVNNPSSMGSAGSQVYAVAWEVSGLVLFVGCVALGWRARTFSLIGIVLFVLAAVAAFLPLPLFFVHTASGSFMSAGCVAFDVLCWSLVALTHHFTRRPYVQTVAIVALCQQVGTLLGYGCGVLFPQAETNSALYVPIVVILCAGLAVGIVYVRRSNKKLLATLFADASVDDLPEEPTTTALPSGTALSYVPNGARLGAGGELDEGLSLQEEHGLAPMAEGARDMQATRADAGTACAHEGERVERAHGVRRKPASRSTVSVPENGGSPGRETQPGRVSAPARTSGPKSQPTDAEASALERISDEYRLTRREREVFAHLAKGRSAPYIAEMYQVSENTVRSHIKHIYTKLDVHSRQELLSFVRDEE